MAKSTIVRHCIVCGKAFQTARADAKFDTAKCRHTHWRQMKKKKKDENKYIIEMEYVPAYTRLLKNCPELELSFGQYITEFGKPAFYGMLKVVDYMITKGCG